VSILWLPAGFAILLSATLQVALHRATSHKPPVGGVRGHGGARIFFLVLPLMMAGVISASILVKRPTWGIGRRVVLVAAVGGVVALGAYFTAVGLHVLPGKPVLLACELLELRRIRARPKSPGSDDDRSPDRV